LYETSQREISERMQAEERFRTLFDFAPEGVLVIDFDKLVFDDVNERAAELFGYTRDELIKISPVDVSAPVQPDGRPAIEVIEEVIQSAMAGGSPRLEAWYVRSSGEEFPVDVQVVKLPEADRNLVRVSFTDITERKQAEEAYRVLAEGSLQALIIFQDGRIIFANPAAEDITGYRVKELLDMKNPIQTLIHPDDLPFIMERINMRARGEVVPPLAVYRTVNKSGQTRWMDSYTQQIEIGGKPATHSVYIDITERKQAEDELRLAKEYAENLIETANAMVIVLDIDGNITVFNKAAEEITGYSRSELLNRNWFEVVVPKERFPEVWAEFERLLTGNFPKNLENPIITKSGEERYFVWKNSELKDDGAIIGIISFGIDITEQKKADEQLERISQEDNKRRQELEKLQEISRSMRQAERSSSLLQVFTKEVQDFCQSDVTSSILFKAPKELITCYASESKKKLSKKKSEAITKALLKPKNGNLAAKIPGFESILILPLQSSDTVYGAVMVASKARAMISPEIQNMLNAIADMAGTALHRIDILETLEERIERRTHDLVVQYNLSTIISENWQLQDLLELSLVLTLETVKADRGIIYMINGKDSTGLKPVIQRGFGRDFQVEDGNLPDDELAWMVFKQQKSLMLEKLEDNSGYAAFNGMTSYAGIPIMIRGDVHGVFSLFSSEKGVFGSDEMVLLASIADQLAIGIENSILFKQSRENAALEERHRLARNLHDSVSQLLYSLTLMAGTTKKLLERESDLDIVKKSVGRFGDTAHQALKEMRLLLYELRPAELDIKGLVSALQHRIEMVEERLGMKVAIQARGLPELPNNIEDTLYHIALEALNNIVKHSESTTANIKLTKKKGNIVMEILDNGKGFDMNQTHRGLGLRNMRERGQMLGGKVVIDSTPGEGTHISVKVKLPSGSLKES